MIKRLSKLAVVAALAILSGQASAESIQGWWNPVGNTADVSWHVNNKGFLVLSVDNNSQSSVITGIQFQMNDGGTIDHLVKAKGTRDNSDWGYTTDARGCLVGDCLMTSRNFWRGSKRDGITAGTSASFKFFGDFVEMGSISNLIVRFQNRRWWGNDAGWGCVRGCGPADVPEPGTLVLFGLGLLGFAYVWRRRRQEINSAI